MSKQQLFKCPAIGSSVSPKAVDMIDWVTDHVNEVHDKNNGHHRAKSFQVPRLKIPDYPVGPIPSIYESLASNNGSGIYTYRGGLTAPPCTEFVHWNIMDTPMYISSEQLGRLHKVILCFTERSTCRHATVASAFGTTNRPPQPLQGRKVLHRCPDGASLADGTMVLEDPIPP
eukprot:8133929-Ditylum_brightwellii.AAC.1